MNTSQVTLGPISVIGKEGLCTKEHNIVSALWADANAHFDEIAALGMKETNGSYVGFWGLMSDKGMNYHPWEDGFSTGLYLAGLEVDNSCTTPADWVKWTVPERCYLIVEIENGLYQAAFRWGLEELTRRGLRLSGAVCDYTKPKTGKNYLFFPYEAIGG